jgi:hypothetical protein
MEVSMSMRSVLIAVVAVVLAAGTATADLKVVKVQHTDGFTVMGRETPPTDEEQTTWIGADRTRMASGEQSTIIRLDTNKLYVVNHADKTYNALDLPIDIGAFMPQGMAEQMKAMMTFDITVTPSDETKKVGEWTARRYDVEMKSQMVNMTMTMWATTDVSFNQDAYHRMFEHLNSLNPGFADLAKEMRKVDGLVIEQQSTSTMPMMGNTSITRTEKTVSIEKLDPPAGTYDIPEGYTEKPFDFMARMQRQ